MPDPTAQAVRQRAGSALAASAFESCEASGLTAERLAFESELGSKGYLSDIEHGRASPSLRTLHLIADHLQVLLVDLFTFPEDGERQKLIAAVGSELARCAGFCATCGAALARVVAPRRR